MVLLKNMENIAKEKNVEWGDTYKIKLEIRASKIVSMEDS